MLDVLDSTHPLNTRLTHPPPFLCSGAEVTSDVHAQNFKLPMVDDVRPSPDVIFRYSEWTYRVFLRSVHFLDLNLTVVFHSPYPFNPPNSTVRRLPARGC